MNGGAPETAQPGLRETIGHEPYAEYAALREAGPVLWDPGMSAFLVTDYAACKHLLRNDGRLVRHPNLDMAGETFDRLQGGRRHMTMLEGEEHRHMHRWWLTAFSPRRVEAWRRDLIAPVVNLLIDRFEERGEADLVEDLAEALPIRVLAGVMGFPYHDDEWVRDVKKHMDALQKGTGTYAPPRHFFDPLTPDEASLAAALDASDRLNDLLAPHIERSRGGEGDDLVSRLWREGPGLFSNWDYEDTQVQVRGIFFAGADATTTAMANAFYLLLSEQIDRADLEARQERLAAFVEESLRLHGSAQFRPRITNAPVEIDGHVIPAERMVITLNAGANRDPAHYSDPDRVDLNRSASRDHLAFNFGARTCGGAALARAMIAEAVLGVVRRLPEARLNPDRPAPRFAGFQLRGYRPLKVVF